MVLLRVCNESEGVVGSRLMSDLVVTWLIVDGDGEGDEEREGAVEMVVVRRGEVDGNRDAEGGVCESVLIILELV